MKKIFILIAGLLLLTGCNNKEMSEKENMNNKEYSINEIIEENNYVIVDVRTKEEYDEGHVKGSINIPYDEIDESTTLDKTKTIIVYCRSGRRSAIAYDTLKAFGFDVYDLGSYEDITLEKE